MTHLKPEVARLAEAAGRPEDGLGKVWKELSERYPGISLSAFFGKEQRVKLERFIKWVIARNAKVRPYKDPNFFAYYRISGPDGTNFHAIARRLLQTRVADIAYVEQPARAPVNVINQIRSPHHDVSPNPRLPSPDDRPLGGIGVEAVWNTAGLDPGCAGAGVRFVDVESGWLLDHEDLPAYLNAAPLHGLNDPDWEAQNHGASALGVLCANEGPGCPDSGIGIAPRALEGYVSSWFEGYDSAGKQTANFPAAIAAAALKLKDERNLPEGSTDPLGDVIVIQAQIEDPPDSGKKVPIEAKRLNFEAIRLATAAGLTVVEAGGNGDESSWCFDSEEWSPGSLDNIGWGSGNLHPLSRDRGTPFMDSGAILVSAANYGGRRIEPFPWWPRGSRMDCFAWGFGAHTCAAPDGYDPWFGGTSAATAIIAGAAIVLQGIARQKHGDVPLTPHQLREAFRQADWNTWPSIDPDNGQPYRIRYMPRLEVLAALCANGALHQIPPPVAVPAPAPGSPP